MMKQLIHQFILLTQSILFPSRLDWRKINVCIIVGTGRIGTGFIARHFKQNFDNVIALHEPNPDLLLTAVESWRKGKSNKSTLRKIARKRMSIRRDISAKKVEFYVESNNNYSPLLHLNLRKVFPNLKVLYVTRDPKSYVTSSFSKHHSSKYRIFDSHDPRQNLRLNSLDLDYPHITANWVDMDRFEKICWMWAAYNHLCLNAKKSYGDNFLQVRYEDIFNGSTNTIEEITRFFELENNKKTNSDIQKSLMTKTNQSDSYLLDSYETWPEEQQKFFTDITQEMAQKLGYL